MKGTSKRKEDKHLMKGEVIPKLGSEVLDSVDSNFGRIVEIVDNDGLIAAE